MERIKPKSKPNTKPQNKAQNKDKTTESLSPSQDLYKNHDEKGKFAKGNLASVGNAGNNKHARLLTQQMISFLQEEIKEYVKDKNGKNTKAHFRVARIRKTLEALWQLSIGWNGQRPDLDAIMFMFAQVDGPIPKPTATEDVIGDRTIQFTLKVSNPNAERDATDLRVPYDGPTIDGSMLNTTLNNGNGTNGHG